MDGGSADHCPANRAPVGGGSAGCYLGIGRDEVVGKFVDVSGQDELGYIDAEMVYCPLWIDRKIIMPIGIYSVATHVDSSQPAAQFDRLCRAGNRFRSVHRQWHLLGTVRRKNSRWRGIRDTRPAFGLEHAT